MRVERWCDGRLPQAATEALLGSLHAVGDPGHELATTRDLAASATSLTFLAIADARPVGVLVATPGTRIGSVFVRWLAVTPDAQRFGNLPTRPDRTSTGALT